MSAKKAKLILVGILGVGALVRFYRLDLTWFVLDQVRDVSAAYSIAAGNSLPLLGPLIGWTHAFLGPFYFYFLAVPFLFARDPIAGACFVALSNILAIFLLYHFARQYFGASVALKASALFAVFPLAIFSSRLVWHAGLLPLFTILFMQALYAVIVQGHSRAVMLLLPLLAILTQLHLTTISLAALVLIAFLIFRPRVRLGHVCIGMMLFLVLYLPYIYYELSHQFGNMKEMARFIMDDQGIAEHRAFTAVLTNVLLLFRPVLRSFIIEEQWPAPFLKGFFIIYGIEALLFWSGMVLCLYKLLRNWGQAEAQEVIASRGTALLFLWLVVPLLILGNKKTPIWWYYLDLLYPSQFVFIAIALAPFPTLTSFSAWTRKSLAGASFGLLLAFVLSQAYFQVTLQQRIKAQGAIILEVSKISIGPTSSAFFTLTSLPLGYRSGLLRALVEEFGIEEGAFPHRVHGAVLGLPDESDYLFRYLAAGVGDKRQQRVISDTHYLVMRDGSAASGLHALRSRWIGPYTIVEYRPIIDYQSLSCAVFPPGDLDRVPDQGWRKLELPAVNFDLDLREGDVLLCRGILRLPSAPEAAKVTVNAIGVAPLKVIGLEINGTRLTPAAQHIQPTYFMLLRSSRWINGPGWSTESVFDLQGSLGSENNSMLVEVAGPGRIFGFDIYDGGS